MARQEYAGMRKGIAVTNPTQIHWIQIRNHPRIINVFNVSKLLTVTGFSWPFKFLKNYLLPSTHIYN